LSPFTKCFFSTYTHRRFIYPCGERTQLFAAVSESERVKSDKDELFTSLDGSTHSVVANVLSAQIQRGRNTSSILFTKLLICYTMSVVHLTLQLLPSVWVINQKKEFFKLINQRMLPSICKIKTAFRYSLSILKIYSIHNMHYRFSVLAVNIGTQPKKIVTHIRLTNS